MSLYFIIDFLVFVFLILFLLAIAGGVLYLIYFCGRKLAEWRYKKIMNEVYLPMIKEKEIREFIESYGPEGTRILALSYLCFRDKERTENEMEEIFVDLAESISYAVEAGTPEYVDSVLHTLGESGMRVRFNRRKEFQYSMKQ